MPLSQFSLQLGCIIYLIIIFVYFSSIKLLIVSFQLNCSGEVTTTIERTPTCASFLIQQLLWTYYNTRPLILYYYYIIVIDTAASVLEHFKSHISNVCFLDSIVVFGHCLIFLFCDCLNFITTSSYISYISQRHD